MPAARVVTLAVNNPLDVVDANPNLTSLREAVNDANAVPAGTQAVITFDPNMNGQTISLDSQLTLEKNIYIAGPGATSLTIQRNAAMGMLRLFEIKGGSDSIIAGLKLRGGLAPLAETGGAILNGGRLTVTGCIIRDSVASDGGGIATTAETLPGVVRRSVLTIYDTLITNNEGANGGGIAVIDGELRGSNGVEISWNMGPNTGGGIFVDDGPAGLSSIVVLDHVYMTGNSTTEQGGGIYCGAGMITLNGGTISFNFATDPTGGQTRGGGIYLDENATLVANNSPTLSHNTATLGDGMYVKLGGLRTGSFIFDDDSEHNENPV